MKRNKKGFTLIELLAVIVILAIIMIIAVPNVLTAMESAKKNSLIIEARKIQSAAIAKRQADALAGNPDKSAVKIDGTTGGNSGDTCTNDTTNKKKQCCYTLANIGVDAGGKYHGTVLYEYNTETGAETWTIRLSDESYQTNGFINMSGVDSNSTTKQANVKDIQAKTTQADDNKCN